MKKFLVLTAALACGVLNASELRDNVGVGLGTLIWEPVGDTLVSQTFAATTNGTSGNQTFAITSGTSNAKKWTKVVMNEKADGFVRDNMDVLARDMSAGSGESLDALAELMSVPVAERAAFGAKLQANFSKIYTTASVTHTQVLENIAKVTNA